MKERGAVYTTVAAALALAMLAMVAYTGLSVVEEHRISSYSNSLLETKRMWQNARVVLDKTASDTLFYHVRDNRIDGNCSVDVISGAGGEVNMYFESNLDKMGKAKFGEVACRMTSFNYDAPSNEAEITVEIECSHGLERSGETSFSVSYSKEMVFEKRVEVTDPSACIIIVTDRQSGEIDLSNASSFFP